MVLCSSRPSVASATLTIVVSRIDMTEPTSTTALIRHTCASMRSESAVMRSGAGRAVRWPENAKVPKGQVPKQVHCARAGSGYPDDSVSGIQPLHITRIQSIRASRSRT